MLLLWRYCRHEDFLTMLLQCRFYCEDSVALTMLPFRRYCCVEEVVLVRMLLLCILWCTVPVLAVEILSPWRCFGDTVALPMLLLYGHSCLADALVVNILLHWRCCCLAGTIDVTMMFLCKYYSNFNAVIVQTLSKWRGLCCADTLSMTMLLLCKYYYHDDAVAVTSRPMFTPHRPRTCTDLTFVANNSTLGVNSAPPQLTDTADAHPRGYHRRSRRRREQCCCRYWPCWRRSRSNSSHCPEAITPHVARILYMLSNKLHSLK